MIIKKLDRKISILGCGWLGRPLAKSLIQRGYTVKGSTTSLDKLKPLASEGISPFLVILEGLAPDIEQFLDSEILIINIPSKNVEGFRELIQLVNRSHLQKVLFISSTSVYAISTDEITEESPVLSESPLIRIENQLVDNQHFNTTILRFSGLVGHHRHPGNWFSKTNVIPNPDGVVNMIHQDDCLAIITQIIEKEVFGETFHAAADFHPTRREFYTQARNALGKELPKFEDKDVYPKKIISSNKIKRCLEYRFKYPDPMKMLY